MQEIWDVLLQLVLVLSVAALLGAVLEKMGQSAIAGYLLAGMLLGPGGLQVVGESHAVEIMAELGIAFLLFAIGLEFSISRLAAMGRFALAGGSLQIALTGLIIGSIAFLLGATLPQAIVIGAMAAPSSTACVMRILQDRAEIDTVFGRRAVGILLLQDAALVPLVLIVEFTGKDGPPSEILGAVGIAIAAFALLIGLFYAMSAYIMPRMLNMAALLQNREILILFAAITSLGSTWLAHELGLSPALGAFIAGVLLAESPLATQIRAEIAPFRVFFVTLFFVSVGMLANLGWMATHLPQMLAVVILLLVVKAVILYVLGRIFKHTRRDAAATAVCLSQVGEFAFVLAGDATAAGIIAQDSYLLYLIISSILITMFLTPYLIPAGPRVGDFIRKRAAKRGKDEPLTLNADNETKLNDHAIVIGYGPAGQQVAQALKRHNVPVLIVEMSPRSGAIAHAEKWPVIIGDATKRDILEHAHLKSARVVIIAIPDHRAAISITAHAAAMSPRLPIMARARYNRFVPELEAAGARPVIDEEKTIGLVLGEQASAIFEARAHRRHKEDDPTEGDTTLD
jgi:monovalent cation:H+ antiporter-2, CPA2 family